MQTAVALLLAFSSTALVNLAYVREHDAVGTLPALSLRAPRRSLRLLLGSREWLLAFAMEALGFALYVVALALAPLALVQSVAAGGVGLLALASARAAHRRLTRREALGAGVAVAGLLMLRRCRCRRAATPTAARPARSWRARCGSAAHAWRRSSC